MSELLKTTLTDMAAGIPARDAEIKALRADRDRLREALENLLSVYDGTDRQQTPGQYASAARAALSQGD